MTKKIRTYVLVFISAVILISLSGTSVLSLLSRQLTIGNAGRIRVSTLTQKSEIRAAFVHCSTWNSQDNWTQIAQALHDSGINLMMGEFLTQTGGYYNSTITGMSAAFGDQLGKALAACHSLGIEVWVSMDVLLASLNASMAVIDSNGQIVTSWTSPTNPMSKAWIKSLVQDLVTQYPTIDGFNFDYIRYNGYDMDYSNYVYWQFGNDTGMTFDSYAAWLDQVNNNMNVRVVWMQWRETQITNLVANMRSWMLAIKPDLKFSATVFEVFDNSAPAYWQAAYGQNTAEWISKGYLDMVFPMMYTNDSSTVYDMASWSSKYFNGGPNGKIPCVPMVSNCEGGLIIPITTANFAAIINATKSAGSNGWAIWAYGGPGSGNPSFPDIRKYTSAINLPQTFNLMNVQPQVSGIQVTVTWQTSLPTSGAVEYSTTPLFSENIKHPASGFNESTLIHTQGIILNDSSSSTTGHSVTISNLLPNTTYYFRVISTDPSGTVSTSVETFTTS